MKKDNNKEIFNPKRWGLSIGNVNHIINLFNNTLKRFKRCFSTKKMDMSNYAKQYLKGLLLIDKKKTISEIARRIVSCSDDGQGLQYFITDSQWEHKQIFCKIQSEIASNTDFHGGMLILDDSGMRKYGTHIAGASRQYIGREGKTENGIVIVCLGYHKGSLWCLVDGELYIPKSWFDYYSRKELSQNWSIPYDRLFMTKIQIGLSLILSAYKNGLPFSIVGCDTWYGRDSSFRHTLNSFGIPYIAKIPSNSKVISELNLKNVPEKLIDNNQYLLFPNDLTSSEVKAIISENDFQKVTIRVRHSERGELIYKCFSKRVHSSVSSTNTVIDEWLFIHQESNGNYKFSLSNLPPDTPISVLASHHCECYFVERNFQDCKSELGWTDMEVRKYRSIMHHTSLVFLCLWFVCLVKYYFLSKTSTDEILKKAFSVDFLPLLSTSNVRDLFKSLFPLRIYTTDNAIYVTMNHLIHRIRSISSKHRKQIREQKYDGF